jgi:hypothetical protein
MAVAVAAVVVVATEEAAAEVEADDNAKPKRSNINERAGFNPALLLLARGE